MIDRDSRKFRQLARAGEGALRQRLGVPRKDMDEGANLSLSEEEFTRTLPLIRLLRKLRDSEWMVR